MLDGGGKVVFGSGNDPPPTNFCLIQNSVGGATKPTGGFGGAATKNYFVAAKCKHAWLASMEG